MTRKLQRGSLADLRYVVRNGTGTYKKPKPTNQTSNIVSNFCLENNGALKKKKVELLLLVIVSSEKVGAVRLFIWPHLEIRPRYYL